MHEPPHSTLGIIIQKWECLSHLEHLSIEPYGPDVIFL